MRPVGNRVLLRHVIKPFLTRGHHGAAIHIPDNFRTQAHEGIVLAVGRGFVHPEGGLIPIDDIKVGDRVLFEKRRGHEFKWSEEDERLGRIISYEHIVAVVDVEGDEEHMGVQDQFDPSL